MEKCKNRKRILLLASLTLLLIVLVGTQLAHASAYYYFKSPADGKTFKGGSSIDVSFYAGVTKLRRDFDAWGNPSKTTYEEMPVTFKVFKGSNEIYSEEFSYTRGTTISTKYTPVETGKLKLCIYGQGLGLNQTEQVLQDTVTIKVKKPKASELKKVKPEITVQRTAKKKAVIECSGSLGYGIKVYRAISKKGKYKLIKTTSKARVTDTGIAAKKVYYYKVRIFGKSGKKTYMSKFSAVKKADKYGVSSDSSALKIVLTNTSGGVKISWKKIKNATYYLVWREGGDDTWCLGANELQYIDKTVEKGKTYTYYVSAWHGNDDMPLVKSHVSIKVK